MRKLKSFVLPAILVLASILRLISINQSLWLDEATTASAAKMTLPNLFTKFLPGDFHPPFYYFLMHFWVGIFGSGEISLRIPSVLAGIATVYIVFLIGRRIGSINLGLIASVFLATSGLHIYYSQEARMYGLATMLMSFLILLFLKERWLWLSVFLVLTAMTDYVSLLILPTLWLFALIAKKNIAWWKKFSIAHVPIIVAFTIWLPTFLNQLKNGLNVESSSPGWWQALGPVTVKNIALIPVKFIIGRISIDNKTLYAAVLAIIGAVFLFLMLKAKDKLLIWFWLGVSMILGIILSLFIPTLTYFRYLFILPAFYLLLAGGTLNVKKRLFWPLVAFVIGVNLFTSFIYLLTPRFWREDWRNLVVFAESKKTGNSLTVFVSDSNTEAYRYYAPDAKITGPEGIKTGLTQIWLMEYAKEIFDPTGKTGIKIESLGYKKTHEYDFNGVGKVTEYENRN